MVRIIVRDYDKQLGQWLETMKLEHWMLAIQNKAKYFMDGHMTFSASISVVLLNLFFTGKFSISIPLWNQRNQPRPHGIDLKFKRH